VTIREMFPQADIGNISTNIPVSGISRDTRRFSKGNVFFIVEGKKFDVFSYLNEIKNETAAFVADRKHKSMVSSIIKDTPVIFVPDVKTELRRCTDLFYPLDMNKLNIVGVTGTNGKTTVTYLIRHLLNQFGVKNALIGTIKYFIADESINAYRTTPDYLFLRKFFFRAQKENVRYIIMEVSSHGIAQKRTEGIRFTQCIFTNLSRDHLDYHLDMGKYFSVKKRLFSDNHRAVSIINTDDEYGRALFSEITGAKYSCGFNDNAYYKVVDYELGRMGLKFTFSIRRHSLNVKSRLIGRHNIYNILSSLASIDRMGFSLDEAVSFIYSFSGLDGRTEKVAEDVFVDYAHTPDALDNVLCALRDCGYNNIILVFGCGGNRDRGKRKEMGRIASRLAVFSLITSDNPRNENVENICCDIESGFSKDNYKIVIDRKKAIAEAVKLKKNYNNCAVLIAGKGHEEYQIAGQKRIPFKDKTVIKSIIDSV